MTIKPGLYKITPEIEWNKRAGIGPVIIPRFITAGKLEEQARIEKAEGDFVDQQTWYVAQNDASGSDKFAIMQRANGLAAKTHPLIGGDPIIFSGHPEAWFVDLDPHEEGVYSIRVLGRSDTTHLKMKWCIDVDNDGNLITKAGAIVSVGDRWGSPEPKWRFLPVSLND